MNADEESVHLPRASFWTTRDLDFLRENAALGAQELARLTGRSVACVKAAAHRHRISLRRPGMRCGLVLGQPRGVSLRTDIRDDLVSGRVDPGAIALRMKTDVQAELCPSCGHRPVRVRMTGLCTVCHKRLLTEKHKEALDELAAHREYNRAKQAAKRMRDAVREEGAPCRA